MSRSNALKEDKLSNNDDAHSNESDNTANIDLTLVVG